MHWIRNNKITTATSATHKFGSKDFWGVTFRSGSFSA